MRRTEEKRKLHIINFWLWGENCIEGKVRKGMKVREAISFLLVTGRDKKKLSRNKKEESEALGNHEEVVAREGG